MPNSFENVGVILKASTGRSLRIELKNLAYPVFERISYVSIKDVENVMRALQEKRCAHGLGDSFSHFSEKC